MERETLWAMAPHIIWPLRFVLPYCENAGADSKTQGQHHHARPRPAWLLRLGLFIYDHLGGRRLLPPTHVLDMANDLAAAPLKSSYRKAFEYSDCWVDDARLVVLNASDAAFRGATIDTRTAVTHAFRESDYWVIETRNAFTKVAKKLRARFLVNAAGPWVDVVLSTSLRLHYVSNVRLVQGSHIVVRKLFDHDRCYFFQNDDGRVFFAIPYERYFTLIGTTDRDFDGDPGSVEITESEIEYLCKSASKYFKQSVEPDRIVWKYSAVRPLFDDGASKAQEATRDYILRCEGGSDEAKLLNIFGGKITTYRKLAETVLEDIEKQLGRRSPAWTGASHLPGGDFAVDEFDQQVNLLAAKYPFLEPETAWRLVRNYGTRSFEILGEAVSYKDLGVHFGSGLTEREVEYLRDCEWAVTAEDILWRRTKLGLHLGPDAAIQLRQWLESHPTQPKQEALRPPKKTAISENSEEKA